MARDFGGGGVGGLVAANALRRRLPREHRVVVVEREESFALAASFLWVMSGDRKPEQISRPLARLRRKGIEVVRGDIERIDPGRREVVVNGSTLDGAARLCEALTQLERGRALLLTAAPAYKCPAAPYEAAMLVDAHFRRRHLRDAVEIALYTAEPAPMGVAGPEVSAAVRRMVEEKDIRYYPERQVVRVDPRERRVELADGTVAEFDLLIYVPPICAPRVVREAGLTNESGWVTVDRNTLETRFPHVYAVGDVTLIPLSLGKPLPKAGVFADAQAEVVARNIARQITGNGKPARFDGHGACFVEAGAGRAGYGAGNFYAEPRPVVRMRGPGRLWHLGKVLFEKYALRAWL